MTNLLWILVAANVAYLLYALFKVKKNEQSKSKVPTLADETRILNVPDHMLTAPPVGKTVNIKSKAPDAIENPWEQKIVRPEHRMGARKSWDHNQLLLKDVDGNLFS